MHATPVLLRYAAPRPWRFFSATVETWLKRSVVLAIIGAFVVTYAWGVEHKRLADEYQRRADAWRALACTYQLRDVERRAPFLAGEASTPDACSRLQHLGLTPVATP